jgi:hypothetical protein
MSDDEIVEKLKKKLDQIGSNSTEENSINISSEENSAIIDENADMIEVQTPDAPVDSTVKIDEKTELTTPNDSSETVITPEDAKKTLIDSANESIQNNDIQAAAKSIGEILAIDEKTASDVANVPEDSKASEVSAPVADEPKTDKPKETPTDAVKLDLSPSINVVE